MNKTQNQKTERVKKKDRKNVVSGIAYVNVSMNNTKISITDYQGNVIAWASGGSVGFKGKRKASPYAAQVAAVDIAKKAAEHGVKNLDVRLSGAANSRESVVRSLSSQGFTIISIRDISPIAHNGCRPPKARRV